MSIILLSLFLWVFWILAAGNSDLLTLIVGGVAAIFIGILWGKRLYVNSHKAFDIRRWFWALIFLFIFIWEIIKANFDVAYRVLHPKRPLSPGILYVKSQLKSTWGRVFLANAITLTPGTLTIDIQEDLLYIHCIRIKPNELSVLRNKIVARFDRYLIKIFD
ncbi:Na+/H+ antiporter subunit E [bacterium]|nr:Na+/H+ antiporter subunit E [bacterium]